MCRSGFKQSRMELARGRHGQSSVSGPGCGAVEGSKGPASCSHAHVPATGGGALMAPDRKNGTVKEVAIRLEFARLTSSVKRARAVGLWHLWARQRHLV